MLKSNEYGPAFKHLRTHAGLTLDQMADRLRAHGVAYANKSGVSHLETRGTIKGDVRRAYRTIFGLSDEALDALVYALKSPRPAAPERDERLMSAA